MNKTRCFIFILVWILWFSDRNVFSRETLFDAWNIAVSTSRHVQAENSTIQSERYQGEAISAERVPRIIGESSYTMTSEHLYANIDTTPLVGKSSSMAISVLDKDFTTSSINVTVPLYLGGKISAMENAQNNIVQAATHQRTSVISQLRLKVTQAYFGVLRMEKIVQVAEATKKSLDNRLKDTKDLMEQGVMTQTAFLSVKVAQANAVQMVCETDFGLRTARSTYNRLLWRAMDAEVNLEEMELPEATMDLAVLTDLALRQRSELARLDSTSRALMAKSSGIGADRAPQVAAAVSYGYLQNETLSTNDITQGTVGMTWMPFDGISRAKEQAVQEESIAVRKMRDELANGIQLQVQKSWNDEQSARHKINVAQEAVVQADENLKLVTEQYREGVITYTEVLDAQSLWTQSYTNLYNVYYNALMAHYTLEFVVGNL